MRVLADGEVCQQPDFAARWRELVIGGERDEDGVPHPVDVHHHLGRQRLNQFAQQERDHPEKLASPKGGSKETMN